MSSFNKQIIYGNLGRDPELSYTPQGTAVCKFSVATNERRRDRSGEQVDITTWFRITCWGKLAENVSRYLSKGRKVYVEGPLHVEEWTDREGKPRQSLEVSATEIKFVDAPPAEEGVSTGAGANGGGGRGVQRQAAPSAPPARQSGGGFQGGPEPDIEDDEIPF